MSKISMNKSIEAVGYGISGDIGGIQKNKYYTPDGRVILMPPNIREFVIKDKDGKAIRHGTRDANLDKGWLIQKPTVLKLYCKGCDRWHDTQGEINACIKKQKAYLDRMEKWARNKLRKDNKDEKDAQITNLEKQVNDLKKLIDGLVATKVSGEKK